MLSGERSACGNEPDGLSRMVGVLVGWTYLLSASVPSLASGGPHSLKRKSHITRTEYSFKCIRSRMLALDALSVPVALPPSRPHA